MMSDCDALVQAVCEHPMDDNPRLILADYLDTDADPREPARAEFIRVGCELAKLGPPHKVLSGRTYFTEHGPRCWTIAAEDHAMQFGLQDGDRVDCNLKLPGAIKDKPRYGLRYAAKNHQRVLYEDVESKPWTGDTLRRREGDLWARHGRTWLADSPLEMWDITRDDLVCWRRGFVDSIEATWAGWLAIEQAVAWCPGVCGRCNGTRNDVDFSDQFKYGTRVRDRIGDTTCGQCHGSGRVPPTMACPICGGTGCPYCGPDQDYHTMCAQCGICSGSGRIPRPFLPSMQPITRVVSTTRPSIDVLDRYGGKPTQTRPVGAAGDWTFAEWPGIKFTLPAARSSFIVVDEASDNFASRAESMANRGRAAERG